MNRNLFDVQIIVNGRQQSETILKNPGTYIALLHNQEYSIKLNNNYTTRCDAEIRIDGDSVGKWRIPANSSITIDRPVSEARKFTFYKLGSSEGNMAGIQKGNAVANGLIEVSFYPEKEILRTYAFRTTGAVASSGLKKKTRSNRTYDEEEESELSGFCMFDDTPTALTSNTNSIERMSTSGSTNSYSSGGTGLGSKSNQLFNNTSAIQNIDTNLTQTLQLRLICKESTPSIIPLHNRKLQFPQPI